MKLLLWLILISVVLVLGCGVVSRKLLYYPAPMDPGREERLAELGPAVAPLSLEVAEKITLRGWMIQKDMKNLPVLFYFGGNAEEISWNIEPYLAKVDANVILINY
ncbi:MAG: hypothetical protein MI802_16400, partial [Desulfobacterales bacterium]|nr:hypothetical protein [Desulfobacterales bacterium]